MDSRTWSWIKKNKGHLVWIAFIYIGPAKKKNWFTGASEGE